MPIGLAVAVLATRVLPQTGRWAGRFDPGRRGHRDGRGRVAGVRAVQRRHHPGRRLALGDTKVVAALAAAVLLAAFGVIETRSRYPLLPHAAAAQPGPVLWGSNTRIQL